MTIMTISSLSLVLGDRKVIDNLSMEFWEGHIHAIVGPNGAGKSSLASTIMGLNGYRNITGDIRFRNESIIGMGVDERARLGISLGWQEPARFEGLSVRSYLSASNVEISTGQVEDALRRLGLNSDEYLDRKVDRTLSGGERKRIELSSLLVMHPPLVLLDEPDSGIDIEALDRIFEAIHYLKETGSTVILITHSTAVLKQAEHAFLLCHGAIVDKGVTSKIMQYFENKCIPCGHKNTLASEELL